MKTGEWLRGTEQAERLDEIRSVCPYDDKFAAFLAVFKRLTIPGSRKSLKFESKSSDLRSFSFIGRMKAKKELTLIAICASVGIPELDTQILCVRAKKEADEYRKWIYRNLLIGKQDGYLIREGWTRRLEVECIGERFRDLLQNLRKQVIAKWDK